MEIDPNDIVANLLNKNAVLTLQNAQLEVLVQNLQAQIQAGDNADN